MDVSVVIPCYNAESYLAQAIGSVLTQTLPPKEIILVDDGSTDQSLSVAGRFDQHVQILSGSNQGAAHARNTGASRATGDAIMFLDADDVLGPNVLEALSAALHRSPNDIAICPWYCLRKRKDQWVQAPPNRPPRRADHDDLAAWLTGWFHPPCSVLWSRPAFQRVDAWDEEVRVNQDGEIMMRALAEGCELVRASHGRAYYRRAPTSEPSVSDARHTRAGMRSRIYVVEKIARLLDERGALSPYRTALGEAYQRIAEDCGERYPELAKECRLAARTYGGPAWWRKVKKARSLLISKCVRAWRRTVPFSKPARSFPRPIPVRHGLNWDSHKAGTIRNTDQKRLAGQTPLVSVIIPTYNRAELLPRALDSVLAQTFDDFELIVVDDASTDDTARIVQAYEDERISYHCQPENRGVSTARNRGLCEARGTYVAFLDSDDEWMPNKLARQIEYVGQCSDQVGMVYTGAEMVHDLRRETYRPQHDGQIFDVLLERNVVYPTSGVLMRRDATHHIGFFDWRMPANEDWDYWLRLARSFQIARLEDVLVRHYDVSGHVRKTHDRKSDAAARARMYSKNVYDMRRAGAADPFLIESARRLLLPDHWEPATAREKLWQAARVRPFAPRLYVMFFRSLLPRRLYVHLRETWRSILSR
jgi:glycosyltransferase involved in cell wall biosynthesis